MQKAYYQGDLDGLCGVYAIINAVDVLCGPLDMDHAQSLFKQILRYLSTQVPIAERLSDGLTLNDVAGIINRVVCRSYPIQRSKPFHGQASVSLSRYWATLQTALIQPHTVVLMGIAGRYNHWTVIQRITDKSLILKDSGRMRYLHRRHCSVFNALGNNNRHWLLPTNTYLLQRL